MSKVRHGKQFANPRLHPLLALVFLAFWAMAVTARIVADVNASAIAAFINVPAHFGGAALANCRQMAQLVRI